MSTKKGAIAECAQKFEQNDTDVIVYAGEINREGYVDICKEVAKKRHTKLLLVLLTVGGDPDAGYRIARAALHHYSASHFSILIPKYCKSAGTLICIGASRLVMGNQAELGPLDIQLRKDGELFKQSSGLDILRGMNDLQDQAKSTFRNYLIDINAGSGLSTKIASEIASKLVIGLYQPMFAQIDPVKLGETSAALEIATQYGIRLDGKSHSLKNRAALTDLVAGYPTHGFVIDRCEAREIFKNVSQPDETEQALCDFINDSPLTPSKSIADVFNLADTFIAKKADPAANTESETLPEENQNDPDASNEDTERPADAVSPAQPDDNGAEEIDVRPQHDGGGD